MSLVEFALHRLNGFRDHPHAGPITGAVALVSAVAAFWYATRVEYDPAAPLVPYKYPILGSTKEYRKDPRAFIEKWEKIYGPVYRAHIFGRVHTIVSGHYVREVFLNDDFDFFQGISKMFDSTLLLNTNLDEIKADSFRQLVTKHLTAKMKAYTPRVIEHLEMGRREILTESETSVELAHLYPLMQNMIAKASASIFAGVELAKNEDLIWVFKHMVLDIGKEINTNNWFLEAFPSFNRLRMWYIGKYSRTSLSYRKALMRALEPEVAKRRAGAKLGATWDRPDDILQVLLETRISEDDPNGLELLVKWLSNLVFVSIHTTSENSTIVLYRILNHPETIQILLEEQDEVLQRHYGPDFRELYKEKGAQLFTAEIIKEFAKLDSVCREAMRLRNEYLGLTHNYTGKKRLVLSNGAVINPGHDVLINSWANHHTKQIQHDAAGHHDQFKPFRFVGLNRQSTKVGDDYLVFGEGKHACPGRWFAIQEIKTIISVLIRDYKFTPLEPITFPTIDRFLLPSGKVRFEKK
ncbi:cytochrome P450 [Dichotomocladium elegans]|nr:cytochrome P450 [Dichotomocladium elegans]